MQVNRIQIRPQESGANRSSCSVKPFSANKCHATGLQRTNNLDLEWFGKSEQPKNLNWETRTAGKFCRRNCEFDNKRVTQRINKILKMEDTLLLKSKTQSIARKSNKKKPWNPIFWLDDKNRTRWEPEVRICLCQLSYCLGSQCSTWRIYNLWCLHKDLVHRRGAVTSVRNNVLY